MTEIHAGGSSVRSGHKENIPIDGTEGGVVVKSPRCGIFVCDEAPFGEVGAEAVTPHREASRDALRSWVALLGHNILRTLVHHDKADACWASPAQQYRVE